MSRIEGKLANWHNDQEKKILEVNKVEKLGLGEYSFHIYTISQKQKEILDNVLAIYHTNPSSELSNIINLLQQIDTELLKLN